MNIKIEGNRVKTTSPYDVRIMRALNRLEGMKRWGANRSFSFENTPHNLEVWRQTFPDATIALPEAIAGATEPVEAIWDLGSTRPAFRFKTPPRAHQSRALEKLSGLSSCGLFMDIGTGKSWTAMAMVGKRWCEGKSDHVLLVAKNGVHIQWVEEQFPLHMSEAVRWKALEFVRPKRKKFIRQFNELMRFDGLKIFSVNIDALNTLEGQKRILEFIKAARGTATMIVDESQDIKNLSASRTKEAIKFGNLCKYRMIMTGTPIAKDLVDLFSQFKFLDERILGHRYITTFRNHYCIEEQTDFGRKIIGHKNVEDLYKRIDPFIFRITSDEALDLPPKVYDQRKFNLSDEQKQLMEQLKQNFFAQFDDPSQMVSVSNAAGLLTKLQQISCGFLPLDDGSIRHLPNPRMSELKNIIEQRDGKIIVWCRFNIDVELVRSELGAEAVTYYGKTTPDQRSDAIRRFMDPNSPVRFLVASPEAAGTGLNLQGNCNTNIYYSNSFNSLARWQSEGRTWRDGTVGTVFYFDLIARKSPDAKILANLREKKNISDMTLDDFRKLLEMEDSDEIQP
jgi:SNF2 family DNA or RNA helicase